MTNRRKEKLRLAVQMDEYEAVKYATKRGCDLTLSRLRSSRIAC